MSKGTSSVSSWQVSDATPEGDRRKERQERSGHVLSQPGRRAPESGLSLVS